MQLPQAKISSMQSSQPFSEVFLTLCMWDYSISVQFIYKASLTERIAKSIKFLTAFHPGQNKAHRLGPEEFRNTSSLKYSLCCTSLTLMSFFKGKTKKKKKKLFLTKALLFKLNLNYPTCIWLDTREKKIL